MDSNDIETLGLVKGTLLVIDRSIVPVANSLVMEDETEIVGTVTAAIRMYPNAP